MHRAAIALLVLSLPLFAQAPLLTAINPATIPAGSGATLVTLTASGFTIGSVVRCGARVLPATIVNFSTLQVTIPAQELNTARVLPLRVERPTIGISLPLNLRVSGESLDAGGYHSAAITDNGELSLWGSNYSGQLGSGNYANATTHLRHSGNSTAQIAAGNGHTLRLDLNGTLQSTGYNASGQLGLADTTLRNTFSAVAGVSNAIAVAAGDYHSLLLMADGTVQSCGENSSGQLGLGDTTNRNLFTAIPGLSNVVAISAGSAHSLALLLDGTLRSWGLNSNGQLGLGDTTNRTTPTAVTTLNSIVGISAGGWHSLLQLSNGTVASCGANLSGQLGLGDNIDRNVPTQTAATGVASVETGSYHSLLLHNGGTVSACGDNTSGQLALGDYTARNTFTTLAAQSVRGLSGGLAHTLFLGAWGLVSSAGYNAYGQLGDGTLTTTAILTQALYLDLTPMVLQLASQLPSTFLISNNGALEHAGQTCLNVFSADPANGSLPYQGPWFGLFITSDELLFFINLLQPPFVSPLDATGSAAAALTLPLPQLSGLQIFGVSTVWDLNAGIYTGFSAITTHTF